jgi:hypothetical protein
MNIILLILFTILILLISGCNIQTQNEKQEICRNDCLSDGWEYGGWIGYNFCNCYNVTLLISERVG